MSDSKFTYVSRIYHHDSGHGWLAVKRSEIESLNILHKISHCSFQKGSTVYLEEDCDVGLYLKAMQDKRIRVKFEQAKFYSSSPIRNYDRFSVDRDEVLTTLAKQAVISHVYSCYPNVDNAFDLVMEAEDGWTIEGFNQCQFYENFDVQAQKELVQNLFKTMLDLAQQANQTSF